MLCYACAASEIASCRSRPAAPIRKIVFVPPQSIPIAPNALSGLATGFKAAARLSKDQKSTKEYATVAKEAMKKGGGSLCVPSFGDWGGALQYPQTYGSAPYTVALTSSRKGVQRAELAAEGLGTSRS